MNIVIASDSWKGSLSARQACQAIGEGIRSALPEAVLVSKPMADGGEGTAEVMMAALGGEWIAERVTGPLPTMQVDAGYAWFPGTGNALVEMASASGLVLLSPENRNPLVTTTLGTGELIRSAADRGASRVWLAVGGSATVDGGAGAAMALGWRLLDSEGRMIKLGGGGLDRLARIEGPVSPSIPAIDVLCDVENPLLGPEGAAAVFGPQKGATPRMVTTLEHGLSQLAGCIQACCGIDIGHVPGGGAAGGLAAGIHGMLGGTLTSGADAVMTAIGLSAALETADWVITGEGRFDPQSLCGKVVSGVVREAASRGVRVGVIAGQVHLDATAREKAWITSAVSATPEGMPVHEAMEQAQDLAWAAGRRFAMEELLRGGSNHVAE